MAGCIKSFNRSATTAFAPGGGYVAAGTMAGAVDLQFSSSANLDIFELDFVSDDRKLRLAGTVPSSERFNRLSWGKGPADSEEYALGVIAGGLVDGSIGLWNPKHLIDSGMMESALVSTLSVHRGPVRGLEFNSLSSSARLLASGADDGEILIWDLSKPSEPSHFPPLKSTGAAAQSEISYLSWNRRVDPILASTSLNGVTAIWDLRKQKSVLSFSDPIKRRCSVLQWHPDVATQLIVASDEDSSPSLKMWDMRNALTPVQEFIGHTRGVISMSWCPMDSSYLLTCAKDNRTICWDTVSGEIVVELPAGSNWNFDVHWYPKIPGLISASSFDGKVGIYNIEGCDRSVRGDANMGPAPLRAPKWYKRRSGVSFGFGGNLISFHSVQSPAGSSEVCVHKLKMESNLINRSSEFDSAVQSRALLALAALCDRKSKESESEEEKETWAFMKVMFNEDGNARANLLTHLGFTPPGEESNNSQDDISHQLNSLGLDDTTAIKEAPETRETVLLDDGENFFDNLPSPHIDTPLSRTNNEFIDEAPTPKEEQDDVHEESSDQSLDDAVQRAIVVGDYKGAVAQCFAANRLADALVIAHAGGVSLWENTRDQYLRTSRSPYLKVVHSIINHDLITMANTRPLKSWKETLALFCAFAQDDEWTPLCNTLASRLLSGGYTSAATLAYICAGNIDKTVEIWSKNLSEEHNGKSYMSCLQDLMEKTIIFALVPPQKHSPSLCKLIEKYAEILASQGLLSTAMDYLNLLGTDDFSHELQILHDRIARSVEQEKETENAAAGNSQLPNGFAPDYQPSHGHQHYYPDTTISQVQPNVPAGPYADPYQQVTTYPPVPHPSQQQPSIFMPQPVAPAPMGANVHLPPVNTQPPAKFIPSNPPMLPNVDQYQKPSTLHSQLYPATASPGYGHPPYGATPSQIAPIPGQQVLTPVPSTQFTTVNNPRLQRPGLNTMQPPSPSQPATPAQPHAAPSAPPPTVQTVDTSNVSAEQKPVLATLTRLFNETSESLGGARANPAKKREIEEMSRKLGALFTKLNSGDISKNASEKLIQLCRALDNGDLATALQIQVLLTTSDWEECNFWLVTLKRMIKIRQSMR